MRTAALGLGEPDRGGDWRCYASLVSLPSPRSERRFRGTPSEARTARARSLPLVRGVRLHTRNRIHRPKGPKYTHGSSPLIRMLRPMQSVYDSAYNTPGGGSSAWTASRVRHSLGGCSYVAGPTATYDSSAALSSRDSPRSVVITPERQSDRSRRECMKHTVGTRRHSLSSRCRGGFPPTATRCARHRQRRA